MENQVNLFLFRFLYDSENGTFGEIKHDNKHICYTVEEIWKENKRNISCIPTGIYELKKRFTQKRGSHLILKDVPNRSNILIHTGNEILDTMGCILPAMELRFTEDNKFGRHSTIALNELNKVVFEHLDNNKIVMLHILNNP